MCTLTDLKSCSIGGNWSVLGSKFENDRILIETTVGRVIIIVQDQLANLATAMVAMRIKSLLGLRPWQSRGL
jgi:hypothetical protein